jgi:two-component system NtrC family sensor kinase
MDGAVKILCIDDEPGVLKAIQRLFLDYDYMILTAQSGEEGFSILEKETVQVVISDYRMPSMDGVEFLKHVHARWPQTVRIVLSGYADMSSIVGAINEGQVYKFVPKPWNDDELRVTVANAIERYFLFVKNVALTTELQRRNHELAELNEELQKALAMKSSYIELRNKILTSYQSLLDQIPVGILSVNEDEIVSSCNSAWVRLTGNNVYPLGQEVRKCLPQSLLQSYESLRRGFAVKEKVKLNGHGGFILGSSEKSPGGTQSIVFAYVAEEN